MPFDAHLADRIRAYLAGVPGVSEKRMFGGICFLLGGRMVCGVLREGFIARVRKAEQETWMQRHGAKNMDFTGKPMSGFLKVTPEGIEGEDDLSAWIEEGIATAKSMPPTGIQN